MKENEKCVWKGRGNKHTYYILISVLTKWIRETKHSTTNITNSFKGQKDNVN